MKTRKMKLNKNFTPPISDEDDEYFANGFFHFNITKLAVFIQANRDLFPVEMIEVVTLVREIPEHLDEEAVQKANLSNPIFIAEISPDRFNVIDGNHRLERARREGVETIPAYRIAAEHHVPFLKTAKAYQSYIGYWNEKVAQT